MSETKHIGSCHCGKVRYEVTADFKNAMSCNCSICSRMGWLLSFVPASQFTLLSGEDSLSDYQFNKHSVHHLFCKNCGIRSFARGQKPDGSKVVAINLRCLEDFDEDALPVHKVDGKSL